MQKTLLNIDKIKKELSKILKHEVLFCNENTHLTLIADNFFKLEFNIDEDLFIVEDFHSYKEQEGNGTLIIETLIRFLKRNYFRTIKLIEVNPDYLSFWEKFGFEYYDENDYILEI